MSQAPAAARRRNRRGDATRASILDAALAALASGEAHAVSVNFVAKSVGATWGAVKYQFGDADGLWSALLDRMAERRGELPVDLDADATLEQRVAHVVDLLWAGLDTPDHRAFENLRRSLPRQRDELEAAYPRTAAALRAWNDGWVADCERLFAGLEVAPERVREVAAFIPGAMRGLDSERHLSTYSDLDAGRQGLARAVAAYLARP